MSRTAIALAAALLVTACGEKKGDPPPPPPSGSRSEAVVAKSAAPAPRPSASAAAHPAPTGAPRALCVGQEQRPAPKGAIKTEAAPGATPLPALPAFGVGKWVWVNLWAAWCGPCKEEMPRLLAWHDKLAASGVLIDLDFVSLDDDERQLQRFLEAQPPNGVRASYWLPDGSLRTSWLGALGLKDAGALPVHALVAPSGQVACIIQGAVEERDYATIAAFVSGKR
jgi:thiol-disulfide isomerase/thioredoxin